MEKESNISLDGTINLLTLFDIVQRYCTKKTQNKTKRVQWRLLTFSVIILSKVYISLVHKTTNKTTDQSFIFKSPKSVNNKVKKTHLMLSNMMLN